MPFQPGNKVGRQFVKGHTESTGNKYAGVVSRVRKIWYEHCTDDEIRKLVKAIFNGAKKGDSTCIKEVMARIWGPDGFDENHGGPLAPLTESQQQIEQYDFSRLTLEELKMFLEMKRKARIAVVSKEVPALPEAKENTQ